MARMVEIFGRFFKSFLLGWAESCGLRKAFARPAWVIGEKAWILK